MKDAFTPDDQPTLIREHVRPPKLGRLRLLVLGDDLFNSYLLPETGTVAVGRTESMDLRIDHPSISRRHLVFEVAGRRVLVTDTGGANGTKLHEERLRPNEPQPLNPGDVLDLGPVVIMLQESVPTEARPRRILTHGNFEARVEDECLRAQRSGATFVVIRVHLEQGTLTAELDELLHGILRSVDLLARYGPSDYEVLLVDAAPTAAERVSTQLEKAFSARGIPLRVGVASYPKDGRVPEALVAKACAGALGRPPSTVQKGPVLIQAPAMLQLYKLVERIASSNVNVLVLGETGVGKEILARSLHDRSARVGKPFLGLNCAALPENLLESELFGHERGAFTGATASKAGLLESADGGTVLLDEIGDMPLLVQAKLLRVIEERQVTRVGGLTHHPIDVRFIAATHRDFDTLMARGAFRPDLYFRLNGISLSIPALRQRTSEIEGLAALFIEQACKQTAGKSLLELSPAALELMRAYNWPGNIRELRNVIERAVLLCEGFTILPEHLPMEKMVDAASPVGPPAEEKAEPTDETSRIVSALELFAGNQTRAAEHLGISRRTLVSRLTVLGLRRPRRRPGERA